MFRSLLGSTARVASLAVRWGPRVLGAAYMVFGMLLFLRGGAPLELQALQHGWGGTIVAFFVLWSGIGVALVVDSQIAVLACLLVPPTVGITSASSLSEIPTVVALGGIVPFQVAGHVAMDSTLAVGRPLTAWHWVAYAAHLLILTPTTSSIVVGLRVRWKAAQRARVRRRTLTIPSGVADLYQRNAYRVLGLNPSSTSTRAVLRRRDEIKALIDVGMSVSENVPDYLAVEIGPPTPPDTEEVVRAAAKLQDEPERYREAVLWFCLAGEDETVLSALRSGDLDAAEREWTARKGKRKVAALYNLAVLAHSRVIASEQASAPPNPIRTDADAWKNAFALWRRVLDDPRSWDEISHLISASTHPRVTTEYLRTLQEETPIRILRVNLDLARAGHQGKFQEYARVHLKQVTDSGFPGAAITAALDEFFGDEVRAAHQILKPLLLGSDALTQSTDFKLMTTEYRATRDRLAALGAESRLTALAKEAMELGRRRLVKETDVTYRRFADADMEYFNGNKLLVDKWNILMELHNLGISQLHELRGVLRQFKARRDGQQAVSTLLDEFVASVKREQTGLEFLKTLAADVGADAGESIEKTIKSENEAVSNAKEAFRKTLDHFNRTCNGMSTQVGG